MKEKRPDSGVPRGSVPETRRRITLKDVAQHLGLSATTVSLVLNRSPVADSIPLETQERVFAAAEELNYRPNLLARSLRSRRSRTIGVLVSEVAEPYAAGVMNGIERCLAEEGYFYLVASHRSDEALLEEYLDLLRSRWVEGVILLATSLPEPPGLPTVVVSGHVRLEGVTNVVLDHSRAARLALSHLRDLGHRRIAFFKGQEGNADTEVRWQGILGAAEDLGLEISEELVFQLVDARSEGLTRTEEAYRDGYAFGRELLDRGEDFTALFAFNDVSAIGATRAFFEAGLRVPDDISVIGFDDILSAAFHNPGLTTVRQPLREMGELAARILLERVAGTATYNDFVNIDPKLVVRGSTGEPPERRDRPRSVVG